MNQEFNLALAAMSLAAMSLAAEVCDTYYAPRLEIAATQTRRARNQFSFFTYAFGTRFVYGARR
jgi:exopolyphosphatase/pppGpp-phosphohydrolase